MTKQTELGRLAMRQEGAYWNAYYAPHMASMGEAILIGSIKMTVIQKDMDLKNAFMMLMQGSVSVAIEDSIGVAPNWSDPVTAPQHEKAGNA